MDDLKGDARPWRVYRSARGLRVTRRVIPLAEMRKGEEQVATYPAELDWNDAKALAKAKFGILMPKVIP